jgi:hypothetical protein
MEPMIQTLLLTVASEYLKTTAMNAVLLSAVFFLVWKLFGRALAHKRVQLMRRAGGKFAVKSNTPWWPCWSQCFTGS